MGGALVKSRAGVNKSLIKNQDHGMARVNFPKDSWREKPNPIRQNQGKKCRTICPRSLHCNTFKCKHVTKRIRLERGRENFQPVEHKTSGREKQKKSITP